MSDDNRQFLSRAERRRAEWLATERRRADALAANDTANTDSDEVPPTDADDATNNLGNNQ